jgi:TRAP transporter TAXI family solute receptor
LPRLTVIAVGLPGTLLNVVGTGIARLVTEKTPTRMRVRVASGIDALVGSGDADFGVSAADATHVSSNGLRHYAEHPQENLRLVLPGPPFLLGFLVREGARYQTVADLAGEPVGGEYPNTRPMFYDGRTILHTVGLTWTDLSVVPVASFREGIQAFVEGRAVAAISSVGSGMTQQADAKVSGVRFLGLPNRPDISRMLWEHHPGYRAVPVEQGSALGIPHDMIVAGKDTYLIASAQTDADTVYAVASLLWRNMPALHAVHPFFARWTHQAMANARVTIPFHDGSIRLLEEVGMWTAEHARTHEARLAALSR